MKPSVLAFGWAALLLPGPISSAATADGPIVAHRAGRELSAASLLLPVGTPRREILLQVGAPDAQLSPNAWVYWGRSTNRPDLSRGLDTLVIVFEADRVAAMKLVAGAEIRGLMAALEKQKAQNVSGPLYAEATTKK